MFFKRIWILDQIKCRCLKPKAESLGISSWVNLASKFVAQVFLFSLVTPESTPRSRHGRLGCGRGGGEGRRKELWGGEGFLPCGFKGRLSQLVVGFATCCPG